MASIESRWCEWMSPYRISSNAQQNTSIKDKVNDNNSHRFLSVEFNRNFYFFGQYGIVSSSCDDRQPDMAWRYTDVFENVDWINSVVKPGKISIENMLNQLLI